MGQNDMTAVQLEMAEVHHQPPQTSVVLPNYIEAVPLMIALSPSWPIWTLLFRILGTALVLSSAFMWILPGSMVDADMMLFKLSTSIVFFLCGLALLMLHHADNRPDAYFDPIRKEVRVLQKNNRGRPQSVLRRSYHSLGSARFTDHLVEVYDVDGSLLMRLPMADTVVRNALRNQLSGLVNITS